MARSYWKDADARRVLAAWQASGESIREFARQRGLIPKRLSRWKRRFRDVDDTAPALLPVHVVDTGPVTAESLTVVLRSGHSIRVGAEFDDVVFARVVAVLERS